MSRDSYVTVLRQGAGQYDGKQPGREMLRLVFRAILSDINKINSS